MSAPLLRRVLLTNDDGIDAIGLRILQTVAGTIAEEVWTIAPDRDQSGASHAISLHSPLRFRQTAERSFTVAGTPADCVVLGARLLMDAAPPELVLSGINRGANIGTQTIFSGTIGAALTGMLLGYPSIALSQQYRDRDNVPWRTAETHAARIIRQVVIEGAAPSCFSINFPNCEADEVAGVEATEQGHGTFADITVVAANDPRGTGASWLQLRRRNHQDLDTAEGTALNRRRISVTPLQLERASIDALASLRERLSDRPH